MPVTHAAAVYELSMVVHTMHVLCVESHQQVDMYANPQRCPAVHAYRTLPAARIAKHCCSTRAIMLYRRTALGMHYGSGVKG